MGADKAPMGGLMTLVILPFPGLKALVIYNKTSFKPIPAPMLLSILCSKGRRERPHVHQPPKWVGLGLNLGG